MSDSMCLYQSVSLSPSPQYLHLTNTHF